MFYSLEMEVYPPFLFLPGIPGRVRVERSLMHLGVGPDGSDF